MDIALTPHDRTSLCLNVEQGESLIRKHLAGHKTSVVKKLAEIQNKGYRSVAICYEDPCSS